MKKFVFISMIAAAALFTACGDDESSTGGSSSSIYSCDINLDMGALGTTHICAEASDQAKTNEACASVNELMKQMGVTVDAGKTGSGCPNGSTKTCSGEKDGVSFTAYFYDAEKAGQDCEELMKDADDFL